MGVEGTVIHDIESKQLIWYGHVQRMGDDKLPKQIMRWILTGKRKRGRPKKNWLEGIRKSVSAKKLTDDQWNYRSIWKLGIGQRRKTFQTDIYIIYVNYKWMNTEKGANHL